MKALINHDVTLSSEIDLLAFYFEKTGKTIKTHFYNSQFLVHTACRLKGTVE